MVASSSNAVADDLASDPMMRRDPYRTTDMATRRNDSQIRRAPTSAGLYDVLDLILDKGIVIDAFVRVSLVGIELLTVDLRVVIASVDTYLRYAEGVERLNIRGDEKSEPGNLPGMIGKGMKARAVRKGAEQVGRVFGGDEGESEGGDDGGHSVAGAVSRGVRSVVGRLLGDEDDDADERSHARREQERPEKTREGRGGDSRSIGRPRAKAGARR